MSVEAREPLYLVDASFFVFRAYYSVGLEMTGVDGEPVNALYGFSRFLGDLIEQAQTRAHCGRLRREPGQFLPQ